MEPEPSFYSYLTSHRSPRCWEAFFLFITRRESDENVNRGTWMMLWAILNCCWDSGWRRGGGVATMLLLSIYPQVSLRMAIWDSEPTACCANTICLSALIWVMSELNWVFILLCRAVLHHRCVDGNILNYSLVNIILFSSFSCESKLEVTLRKYLLFFFPTAE